MRTITRWGNLKDVFEGGDSELMALLATLSVLYEDFQIEHGELHAALRLQENGEEFSSYRYVYFLRRTTATMNEFRGCLTAIRGTKEYKERRDQMTDKDRSSVDEAMKYLDANCKCIKDWRNDFGGHFQKTAGEEAVRNMTPSCCGSVSWEPTDDGTSWLRLNYAERIVGMAMASKVGLENVESELRKVLDIIIGGYHPIEQATYGLCHAFLWNRFGR